MGLALDEQEESIKTVTFKGIPVAVDNYIESYLQNNSGITIDYQQLPYESGFVIYGGSSC